MKTKKRKYLKMLLGRGLWKKSETRLLILELIHVGEVFGFESPRGLSSWGVRGKHLGFPKFTLHPDTQPEGQDYFLKALEEAPCSPGLGLGQKDSEREAMATELAGPVSSHSPVGTLCLHCPPLDGK